MGILINKRTNKAGEKAVNERCSVSWQTLFWKIWEVLFMRVLTSLLSGLFVSWYSRGLDLALSGIRSKSDSCGFFRLHRTAPETRAGLSGSTVSCTHWLEWLYSLMAAGPDAGLVSFRIQCEPGVSLTDQVLMYFWEVPLLILATQPIYKVCAKKTKRSHRFKLYCVF